MLKFSSFNFYSIERQSNYITYYVTILFLCFMLYMLLMLLIMLYLLNCRYYQEVINYTQIYVCLKSVLAG